MLKKYWKTIGHVLLILLLAVLLFITCRRELFKAPEGCTPLTFVGQYSQDGGQWQTLEEGTVLSTLDGSLVLQGRFDRDIREGETLHLLLDHQEYCLYVNGQPISSSPTWEWAPSANTCERGWHSITMPAVTAQDTVELHLRSHHRLVDASGYRIMLDSLYLGERPMLRDMLSGALLPMWVLSILVTILAVGILGVALAFSLARIPEAYRMWSLGLISFCMGGYMCLDMPDISLLLPQQTFVTHGLLLCIVLGTLEVNLFLSKALSDRRRTVVTIALYAHSLLIALAALLCLLGRVLMADLMPFWAMLQIVLCPLLLVCCILELRALGTLRDATLLASCVMLLCLMAELVGFFFPAYTAGAIIKPVFLVVFLVLVALAMRNIATNRRKAGQAERLAADLENSRILMAMNQIRTHFIFNVLNAISGMCKYDPEKADRTVVRFARYLRTNIDIMQSDTPVTFNNALRHMEDYIALEQIRFGDRIRFVTDIEEDYFCLPPLVLQPLVENAIKHGLNEKPDGGTITLRTWVEGNDVCVSISDDGVGFDPTLPPRSEAVGLHNVRFRLQHIMNGSLTIDSAPGQGTTATIRIPLEEATKCM